MGRKRIILILIILIALVAFFWPKEYATSGGFGPFPKSNECNCLGFEYDNYPERCNDCQAVYFCSGIPYDCQKLAP